MLGQNGYYNYILLDECDASLGNTLITDLTPVTVKANMFNKAQATGLACIPQI